MIRIVIADDQLLFAESLKTVLETRGEGLEVVFLAKNGFEAVDAVALYKPDIVLMDINMPRMNGIEAIEVIRKTNKDVKIIVLTTFDDDDYLRDVLKMGANGFLLKDTPPSELLLSIYGASKGVVQLSSNMAKYITDGVASSKQKNLSSSTPYWLGDLSRREKEVLKLIIEGFDNREISERLFIAEQTVKNHVSIIYSKIGVHDRLGVLKSCRDIVI